MKKIEAWQCQYCGFYRKTKKSVENHEKICFHNPIRRACQTCKFNIEVDYDINELYDGENYCNTVKARYCEADDKILDKYKYNCEKYERKNSDQR